MPGRDGFRAAACVPFFFFRPPPTTRRSSRRKRHSCNHTLRKSPTSASPSLVTSILPPCRRCDIAVRPSLLPIARSRLARHAYCMRIALITRPIRLQDARARCAYQADATQGWAEQEKDCQEGRTSTCGNEGSYPAGSVDEETGRVLDTAS